MRTVYLGTSDFAAEVLRRLATSEHRPQLVVTRPDDLNAKELLFDAFFQKRDWLPALALAEELVRRRPDVARLQKALIATLQPPLNLTGWPNPQRRHPRALRAICRDEAALSAVS